VDDIGRCRKQPRPTIEAGAGALRIVPDLRNGIWLVGR
jgi:hypothetical protein